jgi:ABC-2 type transport system permease protein
MSATAATGRVVGTSAATVPGSLGRTLATAGRVLRQLRHDPRTIAMLLVVPALLLGLLYLLWKDLPAPRASRACSTESA